MHTVIHSILIDQCLIDLSSSLRSTVYKFYIHDNSILEWIPCFPSDLTASGFPLIILIVPDMLFLLNLLFMKALAYNVMHIL